MLLQLHCLLFIYLCIYLFIYLFIYSAGFEKLYLAYYIVLSSTQIYLYWCNPLKPSGYYMYHQFGTHKFYALTTQCIYVFCVDLRTNSDYFPILH